MANNGGHKRQEEGVSTGFEAQHAAIIARTLRWADDAADRRDYVEAVRWVETVSALGEDLADEYKRKHARWLNAIERERRSRRG
ncbi:MAG TPA: hypothetical protein VMJ65_13710 [Solirubrobacteraceae bacterium]|nr:hypothetical protein [Solirubrobacteraceae bacterium]